MKTFKGLSAVALLGAVITGCNHLEIQPEEENLQTLEIKEITAYNGDASTKTVLADDRTSILWKPNDQIKVFYGSASAQFTSMNTEPEECTIFSSNTALVYGNTESSSAYIWAVYPYSSTSTHDKTSVTLTVPVEGAGVANSFSNGRFPSIGRSKDTNIAFYNVCGGICFTVTDDNVRSIKLSGNNNEVLAGTVKVGFDQNDKPIVTEVVNAQRTVYINQYSPLQTGTWYYIPTLPVSFTNGFTMRFYRDCNYNGASAILVVNSPYEVRRSVFGQLEDADNNLTYRVRPNSISFKYSQAYVEPLSAVQLTYTLSPSSATCESMAWTSSDDNIATVDQNGLVTGVSCGTCTITLTADNSVSASCTVYVSSPSVSTQEASTISYGSAVLNGSISAAGIDGLSPTRRFLYSKTLSTKEALISSNAFITASSIDGENYHATASGLEPNTTYYYIADCYYYDYYSTNHYYHYYGTVQSFTTPAIPTLSEGVVDLGLSVKWSSTNLGADSPEEIGDLYAWGEVETKSSYDYNNYKWWNYSFWESDDDWGSSTYVTKYGSSSSDADYEDESWVNDGLTVLELADDAARVEWRGKWRMPTKEECVELWNNCDFERVKYNNVHGFLVTSNVSGYTDKRIFLPCKYQSSPTSSPFFWSSSVKSAYPLEAWDLSTYGVGVCNRSSGLPVRPVKSE